MDEDRELVGFVKRAWCVEKCGLLYHRMLRRGETSMQK
jgi:hypothetical protein